MRLNRPVSAALALATATGLLQASGAASASAFAPGSSRTVLAVGSWSDCPQGRMCIWHDPNARGSRGSYAKKARDLSELGGHLNDHVLSYWNHTKSTWCVYSEARFRGDSRKVPREPLAGAKANSGSFGYRISSLRPTFFGRC